MTVIMKLLSVLLFAMAALADPVTTFIPGDTAVPDDINMGADEEGGKCGVKVQLRQDCIIGGKTFYTGYIHCLTDTANWCRLFNKPDGGPSKPAEMKFGYNDTTYYGTQLEEWAHWLKIGPVKDARLQFGYNACNWDMFKGGDCSRCTHGDWSAKDLKCDEQGGGKVGSFRVSC